ncbi:MAG: D-alanyl-D-alanine carboxypeptidase [Mailhella sp.]|nr:D-alanyl-D-alanine carboxypeptidase [Mailhella sp.]
MSICRSGLSLCSALAFLLLMLCALPASAGPINARSAILMDVTTGKVLYEQKPDLRIAPASLTKVLSMYTAMEAISARKADYQDKVKVSRKAARTRGSSMRLKTGDEVTLDKLFYGMAVASGNDASMAVAEHIAGNDSAFVQRMNALAQRLGMKNSRFVNVHGMPGGTQYTTARDMLRMARSYEAKYPNARKYHLAKSVTHNRKTEPNHNPLVGYYRGLNGLKTGWTCDAGYSIIVSAKRNGHKLIGVILGAPNTGVRASEARRLLNAGFKSLSKPKVTVYSELGVRTNALKKNKARSSRKAVASRPTSSKAVKKNVAPQNRKKKAQTAKAVPPKAAPKPAPAPAPRSLSPAEEAIASLKAENRK